MANTQQQSKRKYHIIYQTTNLINNKIYIGAHSTDNLDDEYYGSGTNLQRAIEKYGIDSFKRDILHIFENPTDMFAKEKELITVEFIKRDDVYNIVEGGYGGFNQGSTGLKHIYHPISKDRAAVHINAIPKMVSEGWVVGRNMSSTTNTIWIHKDDERKMIPINALEEYLNLGWNKGLPKSPTKDKVWIFNNTLNQYSLCNTEELADKLSQGWVRKKWAPVKKGNCWINNLHENLRIPKDELEKYLSNGWKKGMITSRWN